MIEGAKMIFYIPNISWKLWSTEPMKVKKDSVSKQYEVTLYKIPELVLSGLNVSNCLESWKWKHTYQMKDALWWEGTIRRDNNANRFLILIMNVQLYACYESESTVIVLVCPHFSPCWASSIHHIPLYLLAYKMKVTQSIAKSLNSHDQQ